MRSKVLIFCAAIAGAGVLVLFARTLTFADLRLQDGRKLHNVVLMPFGSAFAVAKWDGGFEMLDAALLPDGILGDLGARNPSAAKAPVAPRKKDFETSWQFESQYIATEIASDISEMAYYARYHRALDTAAVTVTLVGIENPRVGIPLRLKVHVALGDDGDVSSLIVYDHAIWAPETYRDLASALLAKLGVAGTHAPDDDSSNIVHALLEPTAEVLVGLDDKVSGQLASAFTSHAAHERAALLVAAFGMREPMNIFYQGRFELCRTTAHLAFAEALSGGEGATDAGRIAEALLRVLYNDETDAIAQAVLLPSDPDSNAWKRVVRMRATSDYRIIKEARVPTLAERFEALRCDKTAQTDESLGALHLGGKAASMADWFRILGARAPSVAMGHELMDAQLPAEMDELHVAYLAETGSKFEIAGYKALNAEPGRCVVAGPQGTAVVRVLGWGTWAAFLQRQICAGIAENYSFLANDLRALDEAADLRKRADDAFSELKLYPLVRRQMAAEVGYYHQAQDDAMALVHRSPESVPAEAWNAISDAPSGLNLYYPPPHPFINEWHRANPPPGTAYNLRPRMRHPSLISRPDYVAVLEALHKLAPYDTNIDYHLLYAKYSTYPSPDRIAEIYGPVVDYNPSPCIWIAERSAGVPGAYEKWMRKAEAMSPETMKFLAIYFAGQGRDLEAQAAYQTWMEGDPDSVWMSNSVEWLVEYKERTGAATDATALATKAYNVGSDRGMRTMAHLLEGRKDYERAYQVYAEIRERYDDSAPMAGFLIRMRNMGSLSGRDSLLNSLLKSDFPNGLVAVSDPSGAGPPSSGARVDDPYDESVVTGLKWKDVIVAMNGYRVSGPDTYALIRALDPAAPLHITVWRDGKYVKLPACAGNYVYIYPEISKFGR